MEISKEQYKEIFVKAVKASRKLTAPDVFIPPTVTLKQDDITITLSIKQALKPDQKHGYTDLSGWLGSKNYDCWMEVSYLGKLCKVKDEKITLSLTEYNYLKIQYQCQYEILNVTVIKRQAALKEKATTALLNYLSK